MSRISLKDRSEMIGKREVRLVVAGSVFISVCYDWGFFFALGTSFAQAPTTIADHLQSWLVWLPRASVIVLALLASEFFLRRMEHGKSNEEIIASSKNPAAVRIFRNGPYVFTLVFCIIIVVRSIAVGEPFPLSILLTAFCAVYVWLNLAIWIFRHPTVKERSSVALRQLFAFVPPVILIAFAWGMEDAYPATPHQYATHRMHMPGTEAIAQETSEEVELLRVFEEWALVRDRNRGIIWIGLDRVGEFEQLTERKPFRGVLCHLGIFCPAAGASADHPVDELPEMHIPQVPKAGAAG